MFGNSDGNFSVFSWVHIGKLLNPGYIATHLAGAVTLALIVRPER